MRVFRKQQCLLLVFSIILSTYVLSASAGPTKDKKKLLEKLRNALNQTELEEAGSVPIEEVASKIESNATASTQSEEETPEAKTSPEEDAPEKSDEESEGEAKEDKEKEEEDDDKKKSVEKEKSEPTGTELQKTEGPASYLLKMKTVLRRLFDLFGFRTSKKKEGRQNRMLAGDDSYVNNGLEYEYFREDIKTTVGAVLGEKECIQKIVCGAGSYLRDVNGKHVILTILENVTPSAWLDTMELLKKSAVTDGDCHYKCLEDDDDDNHQH